MSFDVFFQGFVAGAAAEHGGAQMREVLAPHIIEDDGDFLGVQVGDGTADIFPSHNGMMANHVADDVWDLLVQGAIAADWVIIPVGCPTCVTSTAQLPELPAELAEEAVLVTTGADLLGVIASA